MHTSCLSISVGYLPASVRHQAIILPTRLVACPHATLASTDGVSSVPLTNPLSSFASPRINHLKGQAFVLSGIHHWKTKTPSPTLFTVRNCLRMQLVRGGWAVHQVGERLRFEILNSNRMLLGQKKFESILNSNFRLTERT
ncbi:hypothetical protein KP509_23G069600 [Ceratopteris richardii]|uniref:Uncharacterized protein n=1 Tax=Ceratopteris richardii TaxID=49495 RepID=A0A8T2S2S7_CERRI|nr:hypothetical protein KP509_23G069600 [Ceratopteris richardii]